MSNETPTIRLYKEKEKLQQVTHWDLDYLSRDEINDLYKRETDHHPREDRQSHATAKSNQKLSLLLITTGVLLLAGSLFVASLI
jgi:hypothetical protein